MFFQASDLREAETNIRQALRLDPDCLERSNNLGWLLATAGRMINCATGRKPSSRRARPASAAGERDVRRGTLAAAYAEQDVSPKLSPPPKKECGTKRRPEKPASRPYRNY